MNARDDYEIQAEIDADEDRRRYEAYLDESRAEHYEYERAEQERAERIEAGLARAVAADDLHDLIFGGWVQ